MDADGVAPPIYRAPREVLELQEAIDNYHLEDDDVSDDDAAPPPIQRRRLTPLRPSPSANVSKPPVVSPKRLGSSSCQSPALSRFAAPPTTKIVTPNSLYSDFASVPNRPPPPVSDRVPPLGVNTNPAPAPNKHAPPLPDKSPLRSRFEPEPLNPGRPNHARNFSHPFKKQLHLPSPSLSQPQLPSPSQSQPQPQPKYANTSSFRNPPRPLSYWNSSRAPYSLRRWGSLDTIDSVQTAQDIMGENSLDGSESTRTETSAGSRRQYLSFHDADEDEDEDPVAGDMRQTLPASSVPFASTPSDHLWPEFSTSNSVRSTSTTTQGSASKSSTMSIMRKMQGDGTCGPLLTPESLEIDQRISIDRSSRTASSNSSITISSGRPSEFGFPESSHGSTSQLSVSSSDWKSSKFDISGLSEAELKKCKKKGINPALYAEMKAARKGRFVSPIGGNTFI
jgi:hypothetical protein